MEKVQGCDEVLAALREEESFLQAAIKQHEILLKSLHERHTNVQGRIQELERTQRSELGLIPQVLPSTKNESLRVDQKQTETLIHKSPHITPPQNRTFAPARPIIVQPQRQPPPLPQSQPHPQLQPLPEPQVLSPRERPAVPPRATQPPPTPSAPKPNRPLIAPKPKSQPATPVTTSTSILLKPRSALIGTRIALFQRSEPIQLVHKDHDAANDKGKGKGKEKETNNSSNRNSVLNMIDKFESSSSPGGPSLAQPCLICMEDDTMGKPTFQAHSCGHWNQYCLLCIAQHVAACIENHSDVACPQRCGKFLLYTDMRNLVKAQIIESILFERFQTQKRAANLLHSSGTNWIWCPMPDCGEPVSGSSAQAKMECPKCRTKLCFVHEIPWHTARTCEEVDREKIATSATGPQEDWLSVHTKLCPKCKTRIEKNGGCAHMNCFVCKHEFYWCCMRDYRNKEASRLHRRECKPTCLTDMLWSFV